MNNTARQATKLALVPLCIAFATPGAFATTAQSGSLALDASSSVLGGSAVSVPSADSWAGVPTALSVSASATSTDGNLFNTASGSAVATWASADAGSVNFSNYGWNMQATGSAALAGATDWTYTFVATQSGTFSMKYDVVGSGQTFGLWGWSINITGSSGLQVSDPFDPTTSGTFTANLVSGQTYTASLANNANVLGAGGAGSMNGNFDWSISAVPEPDGLALMLAGLAALGVVVRRRKQA